MVWRVVGNHRRKIHEFMPLALANNHQPRKYLRLLHTGTKQGAEKNINSMVAGSFCWLSSRRHALIMHAIQVESGNDTLINRRSNKKTKKRPAPRGKSEKRARVYVKNMKIRGCGVCAWLFNNSYRNDTLLTRRPRLDRPPPRHKNASIILALRFVGAGHQIRTELISAH